MIAFHGDSNVKAAYIERLKAHALADEIVHGRYWTYGKGCAVGCTIRGSDHSRYETELGIDRKLAHLEDRIFEGMANGSAKDWPLRFLSAIPVGADLARVWYQFAHWLLVDPADGVIRFAKTEQTREAIALVAGLYARAARGETVARDEWVSARRTADAAADAADAAADAAYAAYAADAAADAAAADAAAAARRSYQAAKQKAHERQAEKLVELLAAAPVLQLA